jgi:hypothetical protein
MLLRAQGKWRSKRVFCYAALPKKKRPRTVLCWAKAFKDKKEEEENFERVLTIPQREMPCIDKNQKAWTLDAKWREMLNQPN